MNFALFSAIFAIASTVSMGILMIICVVTGNDSSAFIIGSVAAGFLLSLPTAWLVAKRIAGMKV